MVKLFEAFFWIEPSRPDNNSAFNSTRATWHYPQDVSEVTKEFRDIPQFCFPDLERLRLERAEKCEHEHFMFTLIDKDGKRMYGMCMRSLFQGEDRRYDVKRRHRHCLCIISRNPFISLFRTMLLEIHALSMLEQSQGSAKSFVELAYSQSLSIIQQNNERITIKNSSIPDLSRDFNIFPPRYSRLSRVATILPLLEALGVEKFLLILSAVLCERRIILVADDTGTLTMAVLALGAMLHPFQWRHLFIPLLPSKLLGYAQLKAPYILGVRRYLYQQLLKESLDDVILVDIDKGDYRVMGGLSIRDFVGESGNALKQATESLDRVRQRASDMASMFMRGNNTNDTDNGPRDIVAIMVSELRAALANKPGGSSVASVASGLFRGLPGGVKSTMEESKGVWVLETEKLLRDTLLQFFVYLFADVEDFVSSSHSNNNNNNNSNNSSVDNIHSSSFERHAFLNKRASASVGDSRAMLDFLGDFLKTNMFQRFCDEKLSDRRDKPERGGSSGNGSGGGSGGSGSGGVGNNWGRTSGLPDSGGDTADDEDDFYAVCADLRSKQLVNSVSNVRTAVTSRTAMTASALNIDSSNGSCKGLVGMDFHALTVQYTLGQRDGNQSSEREDLTSESMNGAGQQAIDKICLESHNSDCFAKIMHTITLRLESCRSATCRGIGGSCGARAMNLLRSLLIVGPECVLSASIDYIPLIRVLISMCGISSSSSQGLEFTSLGPIVDIRPMAQAVMSLLLDHNKLSHQRAYSMQCREGLYPYLLLQNPASLSSLFAPNNHGRLHKRLSDSLRRELFVVVTPMGQNNGPNNMGSMGTKQFPGFGALHSAFRPPGAQNIDPSLLKLTEAVEASSEKDDIDDECDGNENSSSRDSTPLFHGQGSGVNLSAMGTAPVSNNTSNNNNNNNLSNKRTVLVDLMDSTDESFSTQPVLTPSTNPMISAFQGPSVSAFNSQQQQRPNNNNGNNGNNNMNNNNNNNDMNNNNNNNNNNNVSRVSSTASFTSNNSNHSQHSQPTHLAHPTHALTLPTDAFDEDAIYRIVNQDTGEVHDLRDLDQMMSMSKIVNTSTQNNSSSNSNSNSGAKHYVPTIAPPPSGQIRRPTTTTTNTTSNITSNNGSNFQPTAGTAGKARTTDPFASLTPLIPNSPTKTPQKPQGQNNGGDQFNFTASSSTSSSSSFAPSSSSFVASSGMKGPGSFAPSGVSTGGGMSRPFAPSASGVVNPFDGFAPSISGPTGSVGSKPQPPLGMNPMQVARDKEGEKNASVSKDPFADLFGNIKK